MSLNKRVKKLLLGNQQGKTLLEKLVEGKEKTSDRAENRIYNPLHLVLNDLVELTFEEAGTYEVFKICAYTTRLNQATYTSVRYYLRDSAATEEDQDVLALELMRTDKTAEPEKYLFHLLEEFEYDEDFMELLEDEIFVVTEETDDGEEEKEYEKSYHVTAQVKTILPEQPLRTGEIEIWSYEREEELETLYLTIEMDTDDGWISLSEGRKLLEGELEVYQLSDNQS